MTLFELATLTHPYAGATTEFDLLRRVGEGMHTPHHPNHLESAE
jgi:hypothetical protein